MPRRSRRDLLFMVTCVLALAGCGGSSGVDGGGMYPYPGSDTSLQDASRPPDDTGLPPEREETRTFQTPSAGGRYVYVANPRRDTVAVIDSMTLAIQTVEAGRRPTYLATVAGRDEAIVLNVGSNTATILRTTAAGTVRSNVAIVPGANALAMAPDGRHAVVFLDTSARGASAGSGSFQDISVLTLEPGADRSVPLSVGFRPTNVVFAADGSAAFVVTEDGISILRFADITGPTIVPNVSLQDSDIPVRRDGGMTDAAPDAAFDGATDVSTTDADPDAPGEGGLDAPSGDAVDASADAVDASADATDDVRADGSADAATDARTDTGVPSGYVHDVSVTPDGRWALARVEGSAVVRLVDLQSRTISYLDLGAPVTDLDIAPDGSFALAVVREQSRVVRLPIPGAFRDAMTIASYEVTGEIVGSVTIAPNGLRAFAYTTAAPVERVTVLDLTGMGASYVLRLRKAIRAVAFAPDGRTALIVHTRVPGDPNAPGLDLEQQIDRSFGYTLVEPDVRFAKLQLTPADVGPFSLTPDGSHTFVLLRDDAQSIASAQRVSMRSFAVQTLTLGSPPSSVGSVPATQRVFVGQEHPEGRITFIDWNTGTMQSVTGFELNSRVVM